MVNRLKQCYAYICGYNVHAGIWIGKVLEDMKAKKADPQGDMKLFLYSAVS